MIKFLQTTRVDANIADSVSICFCLLMELFRGILRRRPHVSGYFKIRCSQNFPVHTYLDIFKSATFSLRIQKFPRSHVIGFVEDLFFPLWRADLKLSGLAVEFAGCVRTEAVSGKEKLRI